MMMKDNSGTERHVAGGGTTALGIIGTVLGGAAVSGIAGGNGCGNVVGGWFGNKNNDCTATKWDLCQSERISALEAAIGSQNAKIYSDAGDLSLFERLTIADKSQTAATNSLFEKTFVALAALDKDTAVNTAIINKNMELLNFKIDCNAATERAYVDGHFVKGTLKMPLCKICPVPAVAPAVQPTMTCSDCDN